MGPGPPGPPGAPGVSSLLGVRPGTAPPPGVYVPPAPMFPRPYSGVIPPVIPGCPSAYETPIPSDSPVIPSPPSQDGGIPFVAPAIGGFPGVAPAPQVYRPPFPFDEEPYIPPAPSRTPTESPPASMILVVPGPHLIPGGPVGMLPSHPSRYPDRSETPSRRSRSPPYHVPTAAPTIINMPPAAPAAPTQPQAPPGPPVVQILPSPRPPRDEELEYGPEPREPPLIIHPQQPPGFHPGAGVPMGYPLPHVPPSPSRSSRTGSPRSPIPLRESYPSHVSFIEHLDSTPRPYRPGKILNNDKPTTPAPPTDTPRQPAPALSNAQQFATATARTTKTPTSPPTILPPISAPSPDPPFEPHPVFHRPTPAQSTAAPPPKVLP
jgi:hypothetical protein